MSNEALYIEVYQKILSSIQNSEYPENAPLPAERFLCDKYHVSRSTIRQALMLLKNAEIIYTVHGNGTFIKPQVFTQPLTKFYSFTDTLKHSNIIIQNEIISYETIKADAKIAKKTGYSTGTLFHMIVRLRNAKDYPLMIETTFLPKSRFIKLDLEILSKSSLYEFLQEKYCFKVDKATETFRPVMPLPNERLLLQMPPSTPCILLERFSYEDGLLIEFTKSVVRGDKYIFNIDLHK